MAPSFTAQEIGQQISVHAQTVSTKPANMTSANMASVNTKSVDTKSVDTTQVNTKPLTATTVASAVAVESSSQHASTAIDLSPNASRTHSSSSLGEVHSGRLVTAVSPARLPTLAAAPLLMQLTVQPPSVIARFVRQHESSVRDLLARAPHATDIAAWWGALPGKTRDTVSHSAPEIAGNLDGLPVDVRDAANRRFLAKSIDSLREAIDSGAGRAQMVETRHHLDVLTQISRTLVRKAGDPPRQLLTFDPSGEARAAVVVGDLRTADYVSYLVPGMFFTVQGQMYDWTVIAQDLQKQQTGWIKKLSTADPALRHKTAATVSWIGYTTPGAFDIASLDRAKVGANLLGQAISGIKAIRAGSEPFVSLITHSYGSTAAMMELSKRGVSVDALAMIGSPGSAVQSASALDVRNDNVFVGEAAWDPVVNTAFYGSDPGAASFGAKKMDVSGGTDAITHKPLAAAVGHLGYFDADSEAMRNLALIGLDQGVLVSNGTLADAGRTLSALK